jgi:hypothetical protein
MLDAARPGSPAADLLWLPGLVPSGGGYVVRVRQVDGHLAHLDDARLLVADHASGVQAFALRGAVICGQKQAPLAATDGDGADVVPQIDGANGPFVADSGAVLNVRLAADSAAQSNLVAVEARGETDLAHGLILEVPDGRGSWREKAAIHPRAQFDPIVVDSVGSSTVRIRFLSTHQVRFVGRVVLGSGPADVAWASLTSALSSRSGDVRAAIERPDTAFASLAGPDTLALSYDVPPLGQDLVRDCFLAVDATLVQQSGAVAARLEPSRTLLPALFALRPSQPNPFSGATSIRFDLPVGEVVRIDVFDAQGRRVRSLANRFYPAGYQAVGWNGDDEEGHVARPGIYFCRMEAGNFRGKRQVVLLP